VRIAKTVDTSVEAEDESTSSQDSAAGENRTSAPSSSASSADNPVASPAAEGAGKALQDPEFDDAVEKALFERSPSPARR
jgi:hypothetical protein